MLTAIELESFKCFRKLVLPLGSLTLLTGRNASGKSTVLQSLLLLQQTIIDSQWAHGLRLNGSLVTLGSAADVVDKITGLRACTIALCTHEERCKWSFTGLDRRAMTLPVETIEWSSSVAGTKLCKAADQQLHNLIPIEWSTENRTLGELSTRLRDLQYISAERMGPRETYPLTDREHRTVGALGQNAPSLLYWLAHERVPEALAAPSAPPTLRNQVEIWMREFFPGCGINVQPIPNANLVALGIRTSDETDYHRPQHVGFGLTHILPIITAALISKPPQILLIENPEVHLHPAGQSWIGQFLARVAATGVQVIVETHSDHVLNGIRRAVRMQRLAASELVIHFFRERTASDAGGSQVVSPIIDHQGNLDHWPDGFFDQFDKDMDFFAGWGL